MNLHNIETAKAMLQQATEILAGAIPQPAVTKPRVITKMARNVQMGDVVQLTDGRGSGEVICWGRNAVSVLILLSGERFASFEEDQRVRVVRA